jgi:hypothetical protein
LYVVLSTTTLFNCCSDDGKFYRTYPPPPRNQLETEHVGKERMRNQKQTAMKKNRRGGGEKKNCLKTKILISNKFEQDPRWRAELLFRNDVIGQSHKISNSPSATDFERLVYTHSDTQQLITTDRPYRTLLFKGCLIID